MRTRTRAQLLRDFRRREFEFERPMGVPHLPRNRYRSERRGNPISIAFLAVLVFGLLVVAVAQVSHFANPQEGQINRGVDAGLAD